VLLVGERLWGKTLLHGGCEVFRWAQRALALHINRFTEMLEDTLNELAPNRITEYVFELSNHFNTFYVECKVCASSWGHQ